MEWKPTYVTILFVYCWISTCFGPTGPSSGEFVRTAVHTTIGSLSVPLCSRALRIQSTRTERHRYWTNGCVNSCTNSPEDGPVGPKHVEIQQYTNKIVTSVGFHSICWKDARYKKLKICNFSVCPILTSLTSYLISKRVSCRMITNVIKCTQSNTPKICKVTCHKKKDM